MKYFLNFLLCFSLGFSLSLRSMESNIAGSKKEIGALSGVSVKLEEEMEESATQPSVGEKGQLLGAMNAQQRADHTGSLVDLKKQRDALGLAQKRFIEIFGNKPKKLDRLNQRLKKRLNGNFERDHVLTVAGALIEQSLNKAALKENAQLKLQRSEPSRDAAHGFIARHGGAGSFASQSYLPAGFNVPSTAVNDLIAAQALAVSQDVAHILVNRALAKEYNPVTVKYCIDTVNKQLIDQSKTGFLSVDQVETIVNEEIAKIMSIEPGPPLLFMQAQMRALDALKQQFPHRDALIGEDCRNHLMDELRDIAEPYSGEFPVVELVDVAVAKAGLRIAQIDDALVRLNNLFPNNAEDVDSMYRHELAPKLQEIYRANGGNALAKEAMEQEFLRVKRMIEFDILNEEAGVRVNRYSQPEPPQQRAYNTATVHKPPLLQQFQPKPATVIIVKPVAKRIPVGNRISEKLADAVA